MARSPIEHVIAESKSRVSSLKEYRRIGLSGAARASTHPLDHDKLLDIGL